MQTLEQDERLVAAHYWLVYLLTGDATISYNVALNCVCDESLHDRFFSTWMHRWSRKIVISKALGAIREELTESGRATEERLRHARIPKLSKRNLNPATSKAVLERALLRIDLFPRCVLVLTILEGLPVEDAAVLLDASPQLVEKTRAIALPELIRNFGGEDGAPTAANPFLEWQHA